METIFKHVQDKLKSTPVRFIDWNMNQLEAGVIPASFPFCFIDIPSMVPTNAGDLTQQFETQIELIFGFKTFERSHNLSDAVYRNKALEHLGILSQAYQALHGTEDPDEFFSELSCSGIHRLPVKSSEIKLYRMTFETVLYNFDCVPERTTVPRPPADVSFNEL